MKIVKTLGLVLAVALMFGALSASAAMAYEWQLNGAPITKAESISWTSKLTFENPTEEETYNCTIAHKGSLTTEGRGEITSVTSSGGAKAISCEITHAGGLCEKEVEIEALNLPWATELATVNGVLRDKILGSPEWKIKCKKIIYTDTNRCGASTNLGPHNLESGVQETYDGFSPVRGCGSGNLVTRGTETLTVGGSRLSVSPAPPLLWVHSGAAVSEPLAVKWEGETKLTTAGSSKASMECADTVEGTVGSSGSGEVTKFTAAPGCVGSIWGGKCEASTQNTLTALHLPWRTELSRTEGEAEEKVTDTLVSSGAGTPGFKLVCVDSGGFKEKVECTGPIKLGVSTTGGSSLSASFKSSEKLECIYNGSVKETGQLEGRQTIEPTLAGGLEVT